MDHRSSLDPDLIFHPFDFSRHDSILAAVSGGSDSLAMLLLLDAHLKRSAPTIKLTAVTIDHALRPESAAEALSVAAFCAARGIAHKTLVWSGAKPAAGISAAARDMRYRLLGEAARSVGAGIVVTGHTADDQAETVFMRQSRGGDGLGLAGMAPLTLLDGVVWLARPLLQTRRAALRAFLAGEGVDWADDPTNADPKYERVRVRNSLASGSDMSGDFQALVELAARTAAERNAIAHHAAHLIASSARQIAPGLFHLDRCFLDAEGKPATVHALRVLLAAIGGTEFLPPRERTEALLARLAEPPFRDTLSRTLVASRRDGIWLARETRDLPQQQPIADGIDWDGRFRIVALRQGLSVAAGSVDEQSSSGEDPGEIDEALPKSLVRAARAARPILIDGANVPVSGASVFRPVVAPYRRFLPSFDLELAQSMAALVGAEPFPDPPSAGHIGEEG